MIASCVHCGREFDVGVEHAGQEIQCPGCGSLTSVAARVSMPADEPTLLGSERVLPAKAVGASRIGAASWDFLTAAQEPGEIGRLGPYRVLQVLGTGGMGVVFRAEDPALERGVALKVMLPALQANKSARRRFLREARAAAAVEHDHIVPIYQVGEHAGVTYLAMQLLRGESLEDRLKREPCLLLSDILRIGRETADGLAAAHERGLIHRDVKPANIWLESLPDGYRVKLLDFGVALALTGDPMPDSTEATPAVAPGVAAPSGEPASGQLTQEETVVGTPAYVSPEQVNRRPVDNRTDLFSLGCVLYRISTGRLPFEGKDANEKLRSICEDTPPPPRELNPALPLALEQLITGLLAKNPGDRTQSARAVARELEAIENELRRPRTRRWRRLVDILVLVLLLSVGAFAAFNLLRNRATVILTTDPHVAVVVDERSMIVGLQDPKGQRKWRLKPGEYQLKSADEPAGLRLAVEHGEPIILHRDNTGTIRVAYEGKGKRNEAGP